MTKQRGRRAHAVGASQSNAAPPSVEFSDAQPRLGNPTTSSEANVFRLTYRLIEDLQRVRLAHGNRIRQVLPLIPAHLTPPRGTPSWEAFFTVSGDLLGLEETRVLKLAERLLKLNPIGRWLLAQKGIGPALAISILGECWPISRFASPRKLWAYGGYHVDTEGHAVRRKKGQKANWSARLKTRLWIFAGSALKAGGPWRALYDARKRYEYEKVGAQLHADSQKRLAPAEQLGDAQTLSGDHLSAALSKLHLHNRALRYVQKALLKDLWRVAHGQPPLVGGTDEYPSTQEDQP